MSCPLDATIILNINSAILHAWLAGSTLGFWTKSFWAPLAMIATYILIFWTAQFRELDEPLRYSYHIYPFLAAVAGTLLGNVMSYVFYIRTLLDTAIFSHVQEINDKFGDTRLFKMELLSVFVGSVLGLLAYFLLMGDYSDGCGLATSDMSLGLGITFAIVGGLFILIPFAYIFFWRNGFMMMDEYNTKNYQQKRSTYADYIYYLGQNMEAAAIVFALLATFVFYNIIDANGILRGVWGFVYLTGIYILAFFLIGYFSIQNRFLFSKRYLTKTNKPSAEFASPPGVKVARRNAWETGNRSFIFWILFFNWFSASLVYVGVYLIDIYYTGGEAWPAFVTTVSGSAVFILVFSLMAHFHFLPQSVKQYIRQFEENAPQII